MVLDEEFVALASPHVMQIDRAADQAIATSFETKGFQSVTAELHGAQ